MAGPWESYQEAAGPPGPWSDFVAGSTQNVPTVKEAKDIGDSIIAGLQSSSMGLILRGKLPSVQLEENASWQQRAAAGISGIAGDILPMAGGFIAGAAAGTAVAPGPGTVVGAGAGSFAAPMAIREALTRAYSNNHASSWEGVWDIAKGALEGGAKGAVIGGLTAGAGRLVTPFASGAAGRAVMEGTISPGVARVGVDAAALGAELTTLTTASAALSGKLPTAQDFMDNAILLGGMKSAAMIAKSMRGNYAATGKTPAEQVGDAQADPTIALDMRPVETPSDGKVVEAYHGSPHDFEKFDIANVGTGEGAAAYGYGLYFAEEPAVASEYSHIRGTTISQRQLDAYYAPGRKIAPYGTNERIDTVLKYDNATGEVTVRRVENGKTQEVSYRDTGADKIKVVADVGGEAQSLYKVEIPQRTVDSMLDWDKPLNAQAPSVIAALKKSGLWPGDGAAALLTGGKFYNDLAMYRKLDEGYGKQASSEALSAAGITGNKYLDQGSRAKGEGTRNFVVFNHNDVRIVERNGETIASPTVNAPRTPTAYQTLALDERIRASIDADPRPEMLRQMIAGENPAKLGEPPIADPVKAEYITDQDTLKGVIRGIEQLYEPEIAKQTRGVVTNKATAASALAQIANGDAIEHVIGTAETAAQIYARAHILKSVLNESYRNMAALEGIPKAELTPMMKLQALASNEKVAMVYAEYRGARAEAGRALQIFQKILADDSLMGDAETLIKLAERKGSLQDVAALTRGMDSAQFSDFIGKYTEATTAQKILEAWKSAILTGPQTHLANLAGNIMKWTVEVPESALAATFTAARQALTGDPLTMAQFKARAFAPVIGWQLGALDAIKVAAEVWKQEGQHLEKADVYKNANTGTFGKVVQVPFKLLQVGDVLFRTPAERAEAYIMATDRAAKEGWNPATEEGRVQIMKWVNDPTLGLEGDAALAATKRVQDAGAEAVFAQRLGPHMEKLQRAITGTPFEFASYIIPFFRTPANLLSWAVQHVPGLNVLSGRWREDFAAGGEREARALARVATGAALTLTAYSMAEQGLLTGGGLFQKEENRAKSAAGVQPYSIKIGDKYYSYQRIEPLAKVLGLAADSYDMWQATKDQGEKAKIASMAVLMFGNATISTTYLSGLSNAMQSIVDPERYGTNFLEQYASSLVPKIVGQTVTAADPYKREVDGVYEAVQSQLPFLREKLMPKRDVWGEPTENNKWFDVMPVQVSQASEDKVKTEAVRLHLAIADAPKFLLEKGPFKSKERRTDLTAEQRDVMREVAGHNAMKILAPIVNSDDWSQIPDFAKAAIYQKVLEGTRKQGVYAALPPTDAARVKLREEIVGKIIQQVEDVGVK